jgi:hypothetical protein
MPRFKVAHVREQGVDLIIVPLNSSFSQKMQHERNSFVAELQMRANLAKMAGTVVPVWSLSSGGMGFMAPKNWHSFFRGLSLSVVARNINKELIW